MVGEERVHVVDVVHTAGPECASAGSRTGASVTSPVRSGASSVITPPPCGPWIGSAATAVLSGGSRRCAHRAPRSFRPCLGGRWTAGRRPQRAVPAMQPSYCRPARCAPGRRLPAYGCRDRRASRSVPRGAARRLRCLGPRRPRRDCRPLIADGVDTLLTVQSGLCRVQIRPQYRRSAACRLVTPNAGANWIQLTPASLAARLRRS